MNDSYSTIENLVKSIRAAFDSDYYRDYKDVSLANSHMGFLLEFVKDKRVVKQEVINRVETIFREIGGYFPDRTTMSNSLFGMICLCC